MTGPYISAVVQAMTPSRCMIFDAAKAMAACARAERRQTIPQPRDDVE